LSVTEAIRSAAMVRRVGASEFIGFVSVRLIIL